ncbi:MAG: class I tRNA ligase family protein, partial [Patescibacteria group bacterium]
MPKKIFIGVAWPYVNGDLHIGHLAGYLLPADIFARFHRFLGNDVLMVSGSDCYGTPITIEADKKKVRPED